MKKRILAIALIMIIALSTIPFANAAAFTFTDVPANHKDRIAIEYCASNNFIKGYTDTVFDPDGTITREQFAVIWGRTFQLRKHGFVDITRMPNEYENAILVMQALGHVNGVSDTEFGRTGRITREQAIAITYRAYLHGIDGGDAYRDYSDYANISTWAQNAIGACRIEGVLDNVFTGAALNPQRDITRGEICHIIFNIMKTRHTVTISDGITDGTVTTNKDTAYPGETVTLTITPNGGKVLKEGSLKFNDTVITAITGDTAAFIMPLEDVTITAQFEDIKLASISVKNPPNKASYNVGEQLTLDGMVIEATYTDGTKAEVDTYTTYPVNNATLSTAGDIPVTISYTEDAVTRTTTQTIKVT